MIGMPCILCESDGDWVKLIPIGVLLVIWAIGAMVSAARKAAGGQAPPPPVNPPLPPRLPPVRPAAGRPIAPPVYGSYPYAAPPPLPPPVVSPPAVLPVAAFAPKPPVPALRRRRKGVAPPPLPLPVPVREADRSDRSVSSEFPPAREAGVVGSAAGGQRGEISARPRLTPQSLRSAIVLSEVFDPPPLLRDEL